MLIQLKHLCSHYLTYINVSFTNTICDVSEIWNTRNHGKVMRFIGAAILSNNSYVYGRLHGDSIKYSGSYIYTIAPYWHDLLHGNFRMFTNGQLISCESYKYGKLSGKSFQYDHGILMSITTYKNDRKHGPYHTYNTSGQLVCSGYYYMDALHNKFEIYDYQSKQVIIVSYKYGHMYNRMKYTMIDNILLSKIKYWDSYTIEYDYVTKIRIIKRDNIMVEKISPESHLFYKKEQLHGRCLYFKKGKLYKKVYYKNGNICRWKVVKDKNAKIQN